MASSFPPRSPQPISTWRQEAGLAAAIAAVYSLYLFTSEYHNLFYDAEDYWQLSHRFYQNGRFQFLAYDDAMRGYTYPLVNFLCLAVRKALSWEAVTVVKLLNAGLAGVLFGVVGPRLWRAATGAAVLPSLARRLAWAALGFVFWRGYFNFSLSDFPALLALGAALWLAQRRSTGAALATGLLLALAVNIRPIYLASVVPVLALLLWQLPRASWGPRFGLLVLGVAVVLAPQWLINQRHFQANTPLVLSQSKALNIHNLYLQKLKWGLLHEKYESSVGRELPTGQLLFLDAAGAAVLRAEQLTEIDSPTQYLRLVLRHPVVVAGVYGRHLFAGLDISHPTPYLKRWEPSVWRQLLNYSLWFWAVLVALRRRPTLRETLVLAALLLPCLAVIPMSMEARFLLPLHLLLLALVAFGQWPAWAFQGRRALVTMLLFGWFVLGCFLLSDHIKHTVEPRFRAHLLANK
ncbi:hypothetical protein [Hymenobacter negativus]|uniref:Glycosyltransferase RgtA/B/C/D-like domain-containing protein n=1 Tax=Hymenobacter negativus TaxID=2795026 RepID=A0ABS3QN78_9BACT|nr:hypothetical protein [Hymenobacter negativus]MBO2012562.1 hypothetical protein [Hymenobacter negativus]